VNNINTVLIIYKKIKEVRQALAADEKSQDQLYD